MELLRMKNAVSEIKFLLDEINGKLNNAEEKTSELEIRMRRVCLTIFNCRTHALESGQWGSSKSRNNI